MLVPIRNAFKHSSILSLTFKTADLKETLNSDSIISKLEISYQHQMCTHYVLYDTENTYGLYELLINRHTHTDSIVHYTILCAAFLYADSQSAYTRKNTPMSNDIIIEKYCPWNRSKRHKKNHNRRSSGLLCDAYTHAQVDAYAIQHVCFMHHRMQRRVRKKKKWMCTLIW